MGRLALAMAPVALLTACGLQDPIHGEMRGPPSGTVPLDGGPGMEVTDPDLDGDRDGLLDAWEERADDLAILDPAIPDTDGDGTQDGDEDPDGDGLTNLEEQSSGAREPLLPTLLVELDAMTGRLPNGAILDSAAEIFGAAGVEVVFHVDQTDLPAVEFDGAFEERQRFLRENGPRHLEAALPADRMVHVIVAMRRRDIPARGGEAVTHGDGDVASSGVIVYSDSLDAIHPACAGTMPAITFEEALAATLAHELGHAIQLGHDTEVGGGINHWNLMSVPSSCEEAQRRFHGDQNQDPSRGSTMDVARPRFSQEAVRLMDFSKRLSVNTAVIEDTDGLEM